jgi:hypothetical protein
MVMEEGGVFKKWTVTRFLVLLLELAANIHAHSFFKIVGPGLRLCFHPA